MFESKKSIIEKYWFNPSPHFPHVKIINYVGRKKKVLDVGCATGYLAEHLKKNGCYVVGIEIDEEAAKVAKQFCDEVIIGDIEQLDEVLDRTKFFEVITYSDVLEHLRRPDLVLIKFKKYLASGGYVIASIPNIARIDNRLRLLFGRFDYAETGSRRDRGKHDMTHLRFFTLKTTKLLFESAGYKVEKVDYTWLASRRIFRPFPTLFSNQFIVIAKPI